MTSKGHRLFAAVTAFALFFTIPLIAPASTQVTAKTLDRDADPVILTGESLPGLLDTPLNQLFVYVYRAGQWQQIPWQFDEVKNGIFFAVDNGLLDPTDELVIMGADAGDRAAPYHWIEDVISRSHPRHEITVVDPLNTAKRGWVYVYQSTSLTDMVTQDYVDYDYDAGLFTSPIYKLGFFELYLAGNRLELNASNINVLDRSKLRFKVATDDDVFTEEFGELDEPQPKILDGRVRAIAGYQQLGQGILTFGYHSQFYDWFKMDLTLLGIPLDFVRLSADFNANLVAGVYYDANTSSGVPVDGTPDTVATTPAAQWQQISAASGTVIHTADASNMLGTQSTYYKDDATIDPLDTGDQKSYADMGMTITNPTLIIDVEVTHYILPPNQPNMGAQYYGYFLHPLQAQVEEQTYLPPTPCNMITVSEVTESSDATHEACETLVVGPGFIAQDGANVNLSSGWEMWFMPGFLIESGATLDAHVCGMSLCKTSNSPMPYGCHSCVDQICDADPSCCDTSFDQSCVDMVSTVCGLFCE